MTPPTRTPARIVFFLLTWSLATTAENNSRHSSNDAKQRTYGQQKKEPVEKPTSPDDIVRLLGHPDFWTREHALEELIRLKDTDETKFLALMEKATASIDAEVRQRGVSARGKYQSDRIAKGPLKPFERFFYKVEQHSNPRTSFVSRYAKSIGREDGIPLKSGNFLSVEIELYRAGEYHLKIEEWIPGRDGTSYSDNKPIHADGKWKFENGKLNLGDQLELSEPESWAYGLIQARAVALSKFPFEADKLVRRTGSVKTHIRTESETP